MEARALFDFRACQEDELSFRANEVLKILQLEEDENWYRAELNGQVGYVPKNRVQEPRDFQPPWYKGVLTRNNAEDILRDPSLPDGSFLVRDSESTPGDFSLSVKFQNSVEHYRILRDQSGKYFLWVVKFESLNQLINYHKQNTISRTSHILLKESSPTQGYNQSPNHHQPHHNQANQRGGHQGHQGGQSRQTFEAVTAYRFVGEETNELSFEAGEQIVVHVYYEGKYHLNEDWWFGELRGPRRQSGLFPSNYVTITDQVRQQFRIRTPTAHP